MNNLAVWCSLCQHRQGKGKPLHTSCGSDGRRAEVLQELFSTDKPEKALPPAQASFIVAARYNELVANGGGVSRRLCLPQGTWQHPGASVKLEMTSMICCLVSVAACSYPLPMHWWCLCHILFQRCSCQQEKHDSMPGQPPCSHY